MELTRTPISVSLTVGELRQLMAGKDDKTPVLLYDATLDTYFPLVGGRATRVTLDANDFIIDAPHGIPMGTNAVSVRA